jgi:hypothetical protein
LVFRLILLGMLHLFLIMDVGQKNEEEYKIKIFIESYYD